MDYAFPIKPGSRVKLDKYDPSFNAGLSKTEGQQLLEELGPQLDELQELMYASGQTSVLLVLQGLDTSGKDGTIRSLLHYINVQSCRVASFKVPTQQELAHDFLWRIHPHVPEKGAMTIFNRSHYEDVLVVRVRNLAPQKIWRPRFDHINNFERLLTENGTLILKFFLYISPEEQKARLIAREQDPVKAWKLNVGDWEERRFWDDYTRAYEDVLSRCSTSYAPWYIIPANRKWYRNLAIAQTLVNTLKPYRGKWMNGLKKLGVQRKQELDAWRSGQGESA